jgi:hypothetical protein
MRDGWTRNGMSGTEQDGKTVFSGICGIALRRNVGHKKSSFSVRYTGESADRAMAREALHIAKMLRAQFRQKLHE